MIESICVDSVTIFAVTTSTNASADDLRSQGLGTPYLASVQQGSAALSMSLATEAQLRTGYAVFTVYFATEPIDTTMPSSPLRTSQRLRAQDLILWAPAAGPARTLTVLGPVRDEGGRAMLGDSAWSVDCGEVA